MNDEIKQLIAKRFEEIPKVVQTAILSSDVEKHLRELSKKYKLHFDQWTSLENEVMMTLLGIQSLDKLGENIAEEVEIPIETGEQIANDAAELIFEPIRKELEHELASTNEGADTENSKGTPKELPNNADKLEKPAATSVKRTPVATDPYREPIS